MNKPSIYKLPNLPYTYQALEPYIDAQTMEIHHTKHHQGYINKLHTALERLNLNEEPTLEYLCKNIENYPLTIRHNAGGHYNHTLFWNILSPQPQPIPTGDLAHAIKQTFGTLDNLKEEFNQIALSQFGSGWGWLILDTQNKLQLLSTPNQDNPHMPTASCQGTPLLAIDVWEHAYYLNYQNRRADYLKAIWNIIDWKAVENNYHQATT